MTARHSVRPARPDHPGRSGRTLWRVLSPGPDEVGWRTVAAVVLSGTIVAAAGAALLSGFADSLVPEAARAGTAPAVAGWEPPSVLAITGWLLVVVGAVGPASWLGARLVEALVALESARALERRLRKDLEAQEAQLARLAERLSIAIDSQARVAAELDRARWALDQARADLGHAHGELRELRQSLDVARLDLASAIGSRDDALAAADEAVRQAQASAEVARQAEQELALLAQRRGEVAEPAAGEEAEATTAEAAGNPADAPVVPAWDREPGEGRLAGFASVDLRAFDPFAEADLDDVDSALDAASRKGKHSARPVLDTSDDVEHERPSAAPAAPASAAAVEQEDGARDVA